jgi:ribose 5-phosphate isomerase B
MNLDDIKIHLATDHAGYMLKEKVKDHLDEEEYHVIDHGATVLDDKDDYPDFIHPAAEAVSHNPEDNIGIIFGHSGQGEAMVANRHELVRAGVFYGHPDGSTKSSQGIIELMRRHNNANVLSIAAGFVSEDEAISAIDLWLKTDFSEAPRHERRIKKIDDEV